MCDDERPAIQMEAVAAGNPLSVMIQPALLFLPSLLPWAIARRTTPIQPRLPAVLLFQISTFYCQHDIATSCWMASEVLSGLS